MPINSATINTDKFFVHIRLSREQTSTIEFLDIDLSMMIVYQRNNNIARYCHKCMMGKT